MAAAVEPDRMESVNADVISLTIPAAMRFVRLVRIAVASIGRRKGLSVRAIDDLRLAVDEAFSLLLGDRDHVGTVEVTFEVDEHELLVSIVQRLDDGPYESDPEDLPRFDVVISDLIDRFEADPKIGVVQFSKRFG
ncbi:MAG: ATP-binding protein [Acidimicrobiia bacterium]|nr:ATP-binding protein [Acidimicrobiia bacterium]